MPHFLCKFLRRPAGDATDSTTIKYQTMSERPRGLAKGHSTANSRPLEWLETGADTVSTGQALMSDAREVAGPPRLLAS